MRSLLFVALFGLAALSQAAPSPGVWDLFKTVHGKSYSSEAEEALRMNIFFERVAEIEQHNARFEAGEETFTMVINRFSDMLASELSSKMNGVISPAKIEATFTKLGSEAAAALPDTVDWRSEGIVTPIKDQTGCGCCWAFSTVASFEGQHAKKTGKLVSLSEQQLVDCSTDDSGCGGGWMANAFLYLIKAGGSETEADYPYYAENRACEFNISKVAATLTGHVLVTPQGDEDLLKQAVATIGPMSVAVDALPSWFSYGGGIYYEAKCSSTTMTHGVTVVGYGSENGTDYWLVKNSWGAGWGEEGYIRMSRNRNNNCGIATWVYYPTV